MDEEKSILLPEDVLIGFFANFPKDNKFNWDREKFHNFFHASKIKYPVLLESMVFWNKIGFSESPELDQACYNLKYCGFLHALPPSTNHLHSVEVDLCEKTLKKNLYLSNSEKEQLKEMAEEYVNKFGECPKV